MKLPVLWIVAAFAGGIAVLGAQPVRPLVWLALAGAAILLAFGLLRRRRVWLAWTCVLGSWFCIGALGARLEQLAVPPNHVTRLIAQGRIPTDEALRWRGCLRSDTVRLPWGYRFEVELQEVEVAGQPVRVVGGMRLSYYGDESVPEEPPALRAGQRIEALVRAHPIRNYRNPGAFDAREHFARQNIHLTGALRSLELLRRLESRSLTLAQRMARVRGNLLERLNGMFAHAPRQRAVLRAMLLGDYSFIDHELADEFQKTATYHVLVISGMHVAALAGFLWWIARRLRLSLPATSLLILGTLGTFVAVVEDRPPIERAALMAVVVLLSSLLFRRVELLNTIALAGLIVLAARASALRDPSFQLSFLAAGMIGALGVPWVERTSAPYRRALEHLGDVTRDAAHPPRMAQFRLDVRAATSWLGTRLPERLATRAPAFIILPARVTLRLWEVFLVSATIQLGMLPLLTHYFHRVSLVGPLANIPAALLAGLIVPVGLLTLGLSVVWAWLGSLLGSVLGALAAALTASVEWFGDWQALSYRLPGLAVWLLMAFFAAIVLMAIAARAKQAKRWQLVAGAPLAVLAICVATYPFAPHLTREQMEITVLDVGQGDSIFVAFPDGHTMLVDGGGQYGATRTRGFRSAMDMGEQVVSPFLWQRGLKRLDVVVLTHAHIDHIDGLNAVLENFRVGEVWVGRRVVTPAFRRLEETARARGVPLVVRGRGDSFTWGGVTGRILWPEAPSEAPTASDDDSLVMRFSFGDTAFLLPGDIERPVEQQLLARGDKLRATFLKVPHHGSRGSSSSEMLAAVRPHAAVMSLSETNPFGHPHRELLERLVWPGLRVLRTDRDGAVTVTSDGRALRVTTHAHTPSR